MKKYGKTGKCKKAQKCNKNINKDKWKNVKMLKNQKYGNTEK